MILSRYYERTIVVQRVSIDSLYKLSAAQKSLSASRAKIELGGHSGKLALDVFISRI